MSEETEYSAEDAGVDINVRPAGKSRKRAREEPSPIVENDEPIPLMPHLDKDVRNVIVTIRVWKRNPPGDGFKGDIPPSSTLDLIARRYGNGIYDLEALNQAQLVLRRTQNVAISIPGLESSQAPSRAAAPESAGMAEKLLDRQAAQFESDSRRTKETSDKALDLTKEMSSSYANLIREDSRARTERDREFFAASSKQQTDLFAMLITQMQQNHSQTMEMQREGFNQTIQMMTIQHQQAAAMNNPVFLLSLFKEGLQLGTNLGGDDDPLSMALRTGVAGLGQIKDMMALQAGMTRPKLSAGKTAKVANPSRKPGEKPPLSLTRQELLDLARLKKLAAAKGEDFHGMVKAAAAVLGKPAGDDDPEEDEEDGDEETAPDDGAGHRADS